MPAVEPGPRFPATASSAGGLRSRPNRFFVRRSHPHRRRVREAWYGDPAFVEVNLERLLARDYADARRALVGPSASLDLRPGTPGGIKPRLPRRTAQAIAEGHWTGTGAQAVGEVRGDTVHIAVTDRFGNMVACTPSGG